MRNVCEPLLRDSRAILERLPVLEKALETGDLWSIRKHLRLLAETVASHRRDEDEVVLPVLLRHLDRECAPAPTRAGSQPDAHWSRFQGEVRTQAERLHQERDRLAGEVETLHEAVEAEPCLLTESEIRHEGRRLAELLRRHLEDECLLLTPLLDRLLTEPEKELLRLGITQRHKHHP